MKRCATCNRTYTDPDLSFCTDDGTPLTNTEVPRRRAWPWILGLVSAFILGIIAISIAAAILAPRFKRSGAETNASNENVDTPPPTNHEQVLTQLTDLENEWTAANFNADTEKLDRI